MPIKTRKVCLLGFRSVGKSSLTLQYLDGKFLKSYDPTIENTYTLAIKVKGQEYEMRLVDTAGQHPSTSLFYWDAWLYNCILNNITKEVAIKIYEKILEMTGKELKKSSGSINSAINSRPKITKRLIPIVLVGNKMDLQADRVIPTEMGQELANSWGAAFFETSAKENEVFTCDNVGEIFESIITEIERGDENTPVKNNCMIA